MGQKGTKQAQKESKEQSSDKPEFRHEQTCYLIDRFQPETLKIVVDPSCRHMLELGFGLAQAIAATWSFHMDSILEHAKLNNGILTARIQIHESSNTFLNLASFSINSKEDAEKVALHMMILHALLVENDGVIQFNFLRDKYGRSGNSVEWVEPRITGSFGIQVQVWFYDTLAKGILDVKGTPSCNGKPSFEPKVYHPSDSVVTMMECGGVMIQSVQLAGTNAFWKCSKFR
jgi:hypothetical protein